MPRRDIDDDELARMLRALDPAAPEAGPELDARKKRVWARIAERLDAEPAPSRSSRSARMWWGISLPAVAAAVVALIVVLVANPFAIPTPAAAEGLPPLVYEASDLSLDEHLARAREQLAVTPGPAEPVREATVVAWYSHTQMDGEDRGTVISPEVVTTSWDETFAMRIRVTAGRPYVAGGAGEQPPTRGDLPEEGTVLRDDVIDAEMNVIDGRPLPALVPGSGIDHYRAYVREWGGTYGSDPPVAVRAIEDQLNFWTLTNAQQADLLAVLGEHDGLELLGITHDRAGREAFGVSAMSDTGMHQSVLLISTDTGHILGSETVYHGDDPEIPIPTGTVMSYQMWGLEPDER